MYRIGICDDEKNTCAELEKYIREYAEKNRILINTEVWFSGEPLCMYLKEKNKLDLLFLDIELIEMNGVEVGSYIRNELEDYNTCIVFISSKTNYAMSLFKVQPYDFLVKPIQRKDINQLLEKWIYLMGRERLYFEYHNGKNFFRVRYREIMYFNSDKRKILIITQNGKQEFYGKLADLVTKLPPNFIMIHHSYIINQNYVNEYAYEQVKMVNGDAIPVSRLFRKEVRERIMAERMEEKTGNV